MESLDEQTEIEEQTAIEWPLQQAKPSAYVDVSWDRADWQRLWFRTQRHPWRTLAVVAGDSRISTYEVASLITGLGLQRGEPIRMADVRDLDVRCVGAVLDLVGDLVASGERIVFAARTIADSLATLAVARSADRVLLCVSLGSTGLALVEETVAQVGKERFLGSLLLDTPGEPAKAPGRVPIGVAS